MKRQLVFVALLGYLSCQSFFFGVIFSHNKTMVPHAFVALGISQIIAFSLLLFVNKGGNHDTK